FLTRQAFALLGPDALGRWFMLLQAMALLPLLDLGAQALCAREVATARGATAGGGLEAAHARRGQMLALWPALALASFVAWRWAAARTDDADLRAAIAWVLAANALLYPLRYPGAVLQGLQEQSFLGVANVAAALAGAAVGVGLLWRGHGFSALAAAWV